MSALARAIGILRWLTVMPALAASHTAADAAGRLQIERLFDAVNACGGGIGEVLGVSLLMAAALVTPCASARRNASTPRWLSGFGGLLAVLLAALPLPVFRGPALVPVAAAVSLLSVWMVGAGVWVMRERWAASGAVSVHAILLVPPPHVAEAPCSPSPTCASPCPRHAAPPRRCVACRSRSSVARHSG